MKATILTIGDELLIGQVVNTNAAWLGEQLSLLGVEVGRMLTVGDGEAAIVQALRESFSAGRLVLVTGGLGPTDDDRTVEAVARYFGAPLHLDEAILESLKERWRRRGQPMPASNRRMAFVPAGFEALANPVGSAPGLWHAGEEGVVAVLPGVPREMKALFEHEVAPRLHAPTGRRVIVHRTLLTAGMGESNLHAHLGDLSGFLDDALQLAFLPGTSGVRLRLSAMGEDRAALDARLDRLEAFLRERLGAHVYGEGTDRLEAVVGRLLVAGELTLATAESCTGGLVLHRLTNVPGSSAYVAGGVVAYANEIKRAALGVAAEALEQEGAVSEIVARQMAEGVRRALGADVGVSTTGIAGPGGGTPEKPVGTVWIACADAAGTEARRLQFSADRETNKELSATYALDLVRRRLLAG